jgi:serine/threonine protein kinase/tetratricopeptide (TPR) repeat protein
MNDDDFTRLDEHLSSLLVACDRALAAGETPPDDSALGAPPELRPELERGLACIRLLRKVLPRRRVETPVSPSAELPFTTLGRFEIRRKLGQGSFGVVFQAYDPRLGRDVALKVPREEALVTPELRQRFVREAQAAARLNHPNVVAVYEAGEAEQGCYIASAYCAGGYTLETWLKERKEPVPVREAALVVAALAEAVQHAHSQGVIHRDLKPGNVLLQLRPESQTPGPGSTLQGPDHGVEFAGPALPFIPQVTDFGLAKLMSEARVEPAGEVANQTHIGVVMGTPCYMAPEQASGQSREVGPAADVYALGVILYEVLVGRPPIRGETREDTLKQVQSQEPVPPRRLRQKLPRDLETICLKCLQKEPGKRYASAAALADDLRRFLAGEPIHARPVSRAERLWRWCRRKPAVASLAAALMAAVAVGFPTVIWQWLRAEANAIKEEKQRQRAEQLLNDIHEFDHQHFVELSKLPGTQELQKRKLRQVREYFRNVQREKVDDPASQARVAEAYYRASDITHRVDSTDKALTEFQQTIELLEGFLRDNPDNAAVKKYLSLSYNSMGVLQRDHHRFEEASGSFQRAIDIQERLVQANPSDRDLACDLAISYRGIGGVHHWKHQLIEAVVVHQHACEILQKLVDADPTNIRFQSCLAQSYDSLGLEHTEIRRDKALAVYQQSLGIRQKLSAADPFNAELQHAVARVYNDMGCAQRDNGQYDDAIHSFQESRNIHEKLVRADPSANHFQRWLGINYLNLGRSQRMKVEKMPEGKQRVEVMEEAIKSLQRAGEIQENVIKVHPSVSRYRHELVVTYSEIGELYHLNGQLAEALHWFKKDRDLLETLVQADPDDFQYRNSLGLVWDRIGDVLVKLDQHEDVPRAFQQEIVCWQQLMRDHPAASDVKRHLIQALTRRALALTKLVRHDEALRDWDQALQLEDNEVGRDPIRLYRAATMAHLGKHGQATAEANTVVSRKSVPGGTLYDAACVYSLSSDAAHKDTQLSQEKRDGLGEQYAIYAIQLLTKAREVGFFKNPANVEHMKKEDKDLDPLRLREDFQKLLRELEGKK